MTPVETGLAASFGIDSALDAFLTAIKEVNYDAIPGNTGDPVQDRSWMWQYCSEYGEYYRTVLFIYLEPWSSQAFTNEGIRRTPFQLRRPSVHSNASNSSAIRRSRRAFLQLPPWSTLTSTADGI